MQPTIRPVYSKSTEPIDVVNISPPARFEPLALPQTSTLPTTPLRLSLIYRFNHDDKKQGGPSFVPRIRNNMATVTPAPPKLKSYIFCTQMNWNLQPSNTIILRDTDDMCVDRTPITSSNMRITQVQ